MTTPSSARLIFDIGLHQGHDSEFYLRKGFRVVGIEAAPVLCKAVEERLTQYVRSGALTIVNKAIADRQARTVKFYVNNRKTDWGSTNRHTAEKGMDVAEEIEVPAVHLSELFDTHGTPYFLKSDIEGADPLLISQLLADERRPTFVSVETNSSDDIDNLAKCGYDRFQLVNQWMHFFVTCPNPSREGEFVDAKFNGETSGLFGRDLPVGNWITLDDARQRFALWRTLHDQDENLAPGWIDTHATTAAAIA